MNRLVLLLIALLLWSCGGPLEKPPLAGARMGGAFALTGEEGRVVRDSDFAGKFRLIYFGYTYCPDVCPVDVQKLMQGLIAAEKSNPALAETIQPLFISVDPERDTPAVLREFTANFHPRLIGLTGTAADIARVAAAYGVYFLKQKESRPGVYLVDHSRTAVLYGPKGEPIAPIDTTADAQAIAAELERWAK